MPRALIGLAIAVVVLAVGAIVVVAMKSGEEPVAPVPSSPQVAPPVVKAEEPEPIAPARTRPEKPEPAPAEVAPPPAPEPDVAVAEESSDTQAKITQILESLSEEERMALAREIGRQQMRKWEERRKYQLPSSMRLSMLDWYDRGANKLDEAQKTRVSQIEESMKPRVEASLQTYWDQETSLREQIGALRSSGNTQNAQPLYQQLSEVQQQIGTVKNEIDKEFKEMLRDVLTPEQMEYLDKDQGVVIQSWGGRTMRNR